MLEQPRHRTVSEEFHHPARLDLDKQRTDLGLGRPHDSEQSGDAVGQGRRIRSHHRFAVHTPRLPTHERMFITRKDDHETQEKAQPKRLFLNLWWLWVS
ncbi:hypothetical protein [Amycolatopsis sp. NPDC051061]|uniref:hypothetical protein n=1 Tax=Amycolatopsis sp. NPDC051061 TaxID=3155042 RepID=UPI0034331916